MITTLGQHSYEQHNQPMGCLSFSTLIPSFTNDYNKDTPR